MFLQNGNQTISSEFRGYFPHAEEFGNCQIVKLLKSPNGANIE